MRSASFLSTAVAIPILVLAGCAGAPLMQITYVAPGQGTLMTVVAPQRTTTPIYVDVCVRGTWEKAAVIGLGLVSAGAVIAADTTSFASNPGAKPLSDRAQILLPTNEEVRVRVRSNPELVSGGVITGGIAASCTVPVGFLTEPGVKYNSVWSRSAGGCSMTLTKEEEGRPPETVLGAIKDAACPAH